MPRAKRTEPIAEPPKPPTCARCWRSLRPSLLAAMPMIGRVVSSGGLAGCAGWWRISASAVRVMVNQEIEG